jgi:prepilin-type N-terminal cleavage/methylation domain-containing protein
MRAIFMSGLNAGVKSTTQKQRGTTLLELMIAVALLVIISGAAFNLFSRQQSASTGLSGQIGLNLSLRNATSMLQMDLANAGYGYYQDINIANGALGVTLVNHVVPTGTSCYTSSTSTYGPNCFDQLSIISAASPATFPAAFVTDSTGGTASSNCSSTNSGTAYAIGGASAATVAAEFSKYDQVLFLNSQGTQYTSVILTANASVTGTVVKFTFAPTTAGGANTLANDPLNISACSGTSPCTAGGALAGTFCGPSARIIKLAPITYQVCSGPGSPTAPYACDQSTTSPDIADPKLMRVTGSVPTAAVGSVVMDQVIGFKVGGTIFNSPTGTNPADITSYNYDASTYTNVTANDFAFNFSELLAVRASLIGRTTPATNRSYVYRNTFDGGAYQVQGIAVVVNPRNLNFSN